ncbi:hypothetical protein NA78x_001773 [Anatilimnocola sp. NA78]|uniref:hypothetical protein n=1 Tax=Anatilimnocola sp. NA78 TaxID=3415683 RepID=UPI003CE49C2D
MEDVILKIVRDGWPVSTADILHDLKVLQKQGLLPVDVQLPAEIAELSAMVNHLHSEGKVEKVTGGWKWVAPAPAVVTPVLMQRSFA